MARLMSSEHFTVDGTLIESWASLKSLKKKDDDDKTPPDVTKQRGSNIDARTTGHAGYAISQRMRKRVEEVFGWLKTVGNFRKTRYIGLGANQVAAYVLASAYNLLRIAKLLEAA
jgi:hypothetical protein